MAPDGKSPSHRLIAASLAGLLVLSGCATDGYGYGGVDAGVGYYGGGYDPYYGPAGYGPGYYGGYGGWYNDFYYPGGGYYVFDRAGGRHRWNDRQRAYWQHQREARRDGRGDGVPGRQWRGEPGDQGVPSGRTDRRRWRDTGPSAGANAVPAPAPRQIAPRQMDRRPETRVVQPRWNGGNREAGTRTRGARPR